jgi:hypothetical protein
MTRMYLLLGLCSLAICVACGSSNSTSNFTPSGNFSAASLSGTYVYQFSGFDLGNNAALFSEAGVFTADGKGNLSAGVDDFSEGGSGVSSSPFTGTYSLGVDGTGIATFTFGSSGSLQFAITLASSSKVYLTEVDGSANASGTAELQNTATASSTPSGTYAFKIHTASSLQGSLSRVGAFTLSGGIVSGNEDVWPGSSNPLTLSGAFNAPATNGRGTGTLTDSLGTLSFVYYIVDANDIRFLSGSPGVLGTGQAEMQSGAFTTASLNGGFAFGSRGDTTSSGVGGIQSVGRFSADGNGNITDGTQDLVEDGFNVASDTFSGTYTLSSNGRVVASIGSAARGSLQETFWLVSPTRAFFLVNDPNTVEDGTIDAQQSTSFTNSTMNGQFALLMNGFNANVFLDRVGTLQWDGKGNLTLNEVVVNTGTATNVVLSGSYSVGTNGRTTAAINTLSNNLVFYLISPTDAYVLQNDVSTEVGGTMSKQQ